MLAIVMIQIHGNHLLILSQAYWLATLMLIDDTCSLLNENPSFNSRDLAIAERIVLNATNEQHAELTDAEKTLSAGWALMRPLARRVMLGPVAEPDLAMTASLQKLESFLKHNLTTFDTSELTGCYLPDWKDIEPMFLQLEFLKAFSKLSQKILFHLTQKSHELKGKIKQSDVKLISDSIREISDGLYSRARKWKTLLTDDGLNVLADLVLRGPTDGIIGEFVGKEHIEMCVTSCRDSALAALDAVLLVNVE